MYLLLLYHQKEIELLKAKLKTLQNSYSSASDNLIKLDIEVKKWREKYPEDVVKMAETGNIEDDKDLFKMDELKKETDLLQTKLEESLVKLYDNYEDEEEDEDLDITFDFELTKQPVIEEMPVVETNEKVMVFVKDSKISRFAEMNNQTVNIGFQKGVNYKDIFKIRNDIEEYFKYIVYIIFY